ncbi:glycoside hydrolase family 71 protein [Crucibulum laeve]|uniref:Glycoside hydrolase family 71 protein n=1 Tax=Crucibulum laeve TaxID=68775 RepID=A0A5C3M5V0_9AGAR|nr:glycoside hydrolase family 71 protein [Crucibulum laeve]
MTVTSVSSTPSSSPVASSVEPSSTPISSTASASNSSSPSPSPSTTQTPSANETISAPTPSAPPVDNDGSRKYVVAHHMVGNTFPYTLQDWSDDITMAHAAGIDGFALNVGVDEWQPARVADAYQAALQSGLDFKLFLSLDMTSLPCASPTDAQNLRNFVNSHATHPNQLQYASRAFVSTFAGENCAFGQASVPEGWKSQFVQHPEMQGKIYFVPAFFIDPTKFTDFGEVMDGDFNWNSGWPIEVTTSFAQNLLSSLPSGANASPLSGLTGIIAAAANDPVTAISSSLTQLQAALSKFIGSTDTDDQHLDGLKALGGGLNARDGEDSKRAYMGAVSPWFFTHYGKDSFNKNFIFLADQHLYSKRWESLIAQRDKFDVVQILTWNDYGESHYVGPIKGAQPNSQAWTDGMNHTGWLEMTGYYASAFKTGVFPTIEKDKIVMWSRPHPCLANAPDGVGQPTNFELSEDSVWAVVMATAPSTVTLATSPTTSQTFNVPAGVSKLSIPITAGGTMKGTVQRDGKTVVELAPKDFTFQGAPQAYNFNAFVASATAE